ncbi:CD59 glycoprotein-like isoform X2 [Hyperolius riggenbachi]|uniref:CD59 glycoprotein-like isoform X2 n=1 Tax=Hyperolius riggenbachi TaxID=752182 RepID=UPI0035A349B3
MRKDMLYSFLLFVLLQCHTGYAINCYFCLGDCEDMTSVPCAPNQHCMIREMIDPQGERKEQKGCLSESMCRMTLPDPSLTQWCCDTDLCNRALPSKATTTSVPITNASTASSPSTTHAVIRPPSSPLMCHSCDYVCMQRSTVVCEAGQVCVTKKKQAVGMPWRKYGCANITTCNKDTTETVAGTLWGVHSECCDTNLCNSAITVGLPVISAIGAVLVLWVTKLSS